MLICGAWVYQGARFTEAINIALIYAASPVLIGLGAAWWLGERLGLRQMLGVALALAGVLNVVVKGQWTQLASVPGLRAYWIYGWAQKVLDASRVAVSLYLGPLYGGLAAWWVLGDALD